MPKPPMPPGKARTKVSTLKLSVLEYNAIIKAAKEQNLTFSDFIRISVFKEISTLQKSKKNNIPPLF
jgi:hypothetical protein